jgi:hypothetical protein
MFSSDKDWGCNSYKGFISFKLTLTGWYGLYYKILIFGFIDSGNPKPKGWSMKQTNKDPIF